MKFVAVVRPETGRNTQKRCKGW